LPGVTAAFLNTMMLEKIFSICMASVYLKVEIIASNSKVFCAVQARTKINTHTMTKTHIHINESALTILWLQCTPVRIST